MSSFTKKYGPWAIVAGAAEGLGEAYSTALARRKINLVMVDNQPLLMQKLAKNLQSDYGVQSILLNLDLSDKSAVDQILYASKDLDIGLLIYNAAYSQIKPFLNLSPEELNTFIDLNARTQIHLVHSFSKRLVNKKRSGGMRGGGRLYMGLWSHLEIYPQH